MYLRIVFGLAGVLVAAVTAFNYMANPIGLYNPPLIKGFNDAHPAAVNYARLEKIEAVKRLRPDVIITGSSRADIGLDPTAEYFPGRRVYNFGLSASSINEQKQVLAFAQAVHPLKEAIITLDYFCFNARRLENKAFEPARLSPAALTPWRSFTDTYGTIASLDTLAASIKNIRYLRQLDRRAYAEPNGHKVSNDVFYDIKIHGMAKMFAHPPAAQETSVDDFSTDYADGTSTYKHLEEMLDFARAHNIKVTLLISPVHFRDMHDVDAKETAWKKKVEDIIRANGRKHAAAPYPLWDFAYPNSLTTEPIPQDKTGRMKWFLDGGHYTTEMGYIVLQKILGLPQARKYPGFGRKVT